jgi:hypothetical protein
MSKLARALALTALLAALSLAPLPAIAQTHAADHATSQEAKPPATQGQGTAPQQAAADAAHRRLLAQERAYTSWGYANPAVQQALAQERSYSTSGYGEVSPPAPAEPSGQPPWLVIALSGLAAVGALVAGVAVLAARRATRGQRASQTA